MVGDKSSELSVLVRVSILPLTVLWLELRLRGPAFFRDVFCGEIMSKTLDKSFGFFGVDSSLDEDGPGATYNQYK